MAIITIEDQVFKQIMSKLGYPLTSIADFPINESDLKDLYIWQAMREYWKWFPIPYEQEFTIGNRFEIDFPDTETFNVLDVRLNTNVPQTGMTGLVSSDPFINVQSIQRIGTSGRYGTPYNYQDTTTYFYRRAELQAIKNSQNAFRPKVDITNRKLIGYSNLTGRITITWAKYSYDFGDIPFQRIDEVVKLAQAYIAEGFGNVINLQSTDLPNNLDGDFLSTMANDYKEEVLTKWKGMTKVAIIRK